MIGYRIKHFRTENNLTLSDLADRAGVSKSYLSYIERGLQQNPSIQVLEKIAGVFDVDVNTLLHENTEIDNKTEFGKEWVELVSDVEKARITETEINELKDYIEFLKWKNEREEGTGGKR